MTTTRKLRPPIKRHGGKAYLARRIIALMPPHRVYVEPFLGGGSVLLNKPRAEAEVAGDVDAFLIGFWGHLQRNPDWLCRTLARIGYGEDEFKAAVRCFGLYAANGSTILYDKTPVPSYNLAIAYLIRNRMSRGGLGKAFAWSDRLRGGKPGDANAWDTIRAELPAIADRLAGVRLCHAPALDLIRELDGPETLVYADPPYHHATRTARDVYDHEMAEADHVALLDALGRCRSAVLLSGYRCDLYDAALAGWRRVEFDMPNHAGQGKTKQRRVECLWTKEAGARNEPPAVDVTAGASRTE